MDSCGKYIEISPRKFANPSGSVKFRQWRLGGTQNQKLPIPLKHAYKTTLGFSYDFAASLWHPLYLMLWCFATCWMANVHLLKCTRVNRPWTRFSFPWWPVSEDPGRLWSVGSQLQLIVLHVANHLGCIKYNVNNEIKWVSYLSTCAAFLPLTVPVNDWVKLTYDTG